MITYDNRTKKVLPEELENFKFLAGKTIGELTAEKFPGLLVFPRDLGLSEDLTADSCIYSLSLKKGNVEMETNNIVGFVGIGNSQLTIRSRFTDSNQEDYFLHYMLEKVMAINVVDFMHQTAEEQIFEFLIFLFPVLIKRAMRQGVFREYQSRHYDDANIKGRVDVARFVRNDIPFSGHVAYRTREYSADNDMNQLIRHTIEYIRTKKVNGELAYRYLLSRDDEMKRAVSLVCANTPSYQLQNRQKVIFRNLRPLRHPYFSAYLPLQRLCVQILSHQSLKYGQDKEKIHGVLFDVAWLWEEYLNTLLKPMAFLHPQNRKRKGALYLFEDNRYQPRYPDFYLGDIVLDAKYKGGVQREDYHQMITYQYILNGRMGGFISPNENTELHRLGRLNGYGAQLFTFHLGISKGCVSYSDFRRKMKEQEYNFAQALDACVGQICTKIAFAPLRTCVRSGSWRNKLWFNDFNK